MRPRRRNPVSPRPPQKKNTRRPRWVEWSQTDRAMDAQAIAVGRSSRSVALFAALLVAACSPSGEATFSQGGAPSGAAAGNSATAGAPGTAVTSVEVSPSGGATGGTTTGGASTIGG